MYLWMASAENFQILKGEMPDSFGVPPPTPLPRPCLNGFSLQHYHSCDTSKPVAGVAGHVIPKSASVTKGTNTGDLQ